MRLLGVFVAFFLAFARCHEEVSSDITEEPVTEVVTEVPKPVYPSPILPASCGKPKGIEKCEEYMCWAKASVGECVLIEFDDVNITMSTPGVDSSCKREEGICVEITDKTHVSVSGKVTKVPQIVLILDQEGSIKKNITIAETEPSLKPPTLPQPEEPLEPIEFPEKCETIIKTTNGTDGHFWAIANRGDCVQILAVVNKTLFDSDPLYDPSCDRGRTLCAGYVRQSDTFLIEGRVWKTPLIVYGIDEKGNTKYTWSFDERAQVEPPAPKPPKFPYSCDKVVTTMTCNGIPCWIQASKGDCVEAVIKTDHIAMTVPENDPECDPDTRLCVYERHMETVRIRGRLTSDAEQVVLVASNRYVRMLISLQPTEPEMNKPGSPQVNVYPVERLPVGARSMIYARLGDPKQQQQQPDQGGSNNNNGATMGSTTSSSNKVYAATGLALASLGIRLLA